MSANSEMTLAVAYERATAALRESLAQTTIADILRNTLAEARIRAHLELQHA